MPGRILPDDPIPDVVPDLAIEVLSKSNTPSEMHRKREEYFRAGVRIVWGNRSRQTKRSRLHERRPVSRDLSGTDVLSGALVLPGFTLPLAQLFAELDRHG